MPLKLSMNKPKAKVVVISSLDKSAKEDTPSVVNRPSTNRRLIDGRPAGRPTTPTKIKRQTDQKRPGLLDVDLVRFVLDNASNYDTALAELPKTISFDPIKRRLRCAGHMINLAAEAFLFGSYPSELNKQLQEEVSDTAKLRL